MSKFKKTLLVLVGVSLLSLLVTACQQDSFIRQRAEGQDIVFEVNIAGNMVEAFRIESDSTGSKLNNSVEDKDMSLCVNDGGVEKCLTVDGPTADVSVPADFSVTGSITGGTFDGTLGTGTVSGGTGGVITDGTITGTDIASETITSSNFDCSITGNTKRCLCISNVDGGI